MLIGYVRVSKSDGTQTLAPQRDAMLAAGVDPTRIFAFLFHSIRHVLFLLFFVLVSA